MSLREGTTKQSHGSIAALYNTRLPRDAYNDVIVSYWLLAMFLLTVLWIWALPAARAIRSYCTGISHKAGIRYYR